MSVPIFLIFFVRFCHSSRMLTLSRAKLKAVVRAVPYLEKFIKRLCQFLYDCTCSSCGVSLNSGGPTNLEGINKNGVTMQDVFPILTRYDVNVSPFHWAFTDWRRVSPLSALRCRPPERVGQEWTNKSPSIYMMFMRQK